MCNESSTAENDPHKQSTSQGGDIKGDGIEIFKKNRKSEGIGM